MIRTILKSAWLVSSSMVAAGLELVGRTRTVSPTVVKPTQESLDRIQAAQSKRDRRAAKKGMK